MSTAATKEAQALRASDLRPPCGLRLGWEPGSIQARGSMEHSRRWDMAPHSFFGLIHLVHFHVCSQVSADCFFLLENVFLLPATFCRRDWGGCSTWDQWVSGRHHSANEKHSRCSRLIWFPAETNLLESLLHSWGPLVSLKLWTPLAIGGLRPVQWPCRAALL